jgi:iron complex outermembrane receptor protein
MPAQGNDFSLYLIKKTSAMKRMMLLLLPGIMPLMLHAQSAIYGTVTDDFGSPLIGANVYVDETFQGAITDINGHYRISRLKNGSYIIRISYIGYSTKTRIINLETDTELNFKLTKANILAEEVIVSATRARDRSPLTYSTVTQEEIRERNFGQDIPHLLSLTPSIVTTSDAGTGIGYTSFRIRGTDMNRINIIINGIPLNDAESHGVWWVDLPDFASSVENVQIQRGVGTSTNGAGAFGATLNFQTFKMNRRAYAEASSSYGSFNTLKNTVSVGSGLLKNRFTVDLRMSKINSDGYIDRASADLSSFYLQGAYYSKRSLLKLNVFSGTEKTYQSWMGIPSDILETDRTYNPSGMYINQDGDTDYYKNQTDNYRQDHYQLLYSFEINDYWTLNTAVHYTHGKGYYETYRQDDDLADYDIPDLVIGDTVITSTDLIRQKWLDNDFLGATFSSRYRYGRFDATLGGGYHYYDGHHFGKVIWAKYTGDAEHDHEWYRGTGLKKDGNLYAKLHYQVLNALNVFGDIQVRHIRHEITGIHDDLRDIGQEHDYTFINPKLGLHYQINNAHSMFISFATASREPNRSNFVDADPGHPVAEAETLYDYELGYRLGLNQVKLAATVYYMDYKDQLVLTGEINNTGAPIMTNVDDSYRTGIELESSVSLLGRLFLDVNATFSMNRIKNFTEYVDNWNYWDDPASEPLQYIRELGDTYLSFSPGIIAAGNLSFEVIDNFMIGLMSKYVGKQYIDNSASEERKLDPFFVNNINASYSLKTSFPERITIRFQVNNIFNSQYESNAWVYRYVYDGEEYFMDGYFPQAGSHFMGGVTVRF